MNSMSNNIYNKILNLLPFVSVTFLFILIVVLSYSIFDSKGTYSIIDSNCMSGADMTGCSDNDTDHWACPKGYSQLEVAKMQSSSDVSGWCCKDGLRKTHVPGENKDWVPDRADTYITCVDDDWWKSGDALSKKILASEDKGWCYPDYGIGPLGNAQYCHTGSDNCASKYGGHFEDIGFNGCCVVDCAFAPVKAVYTAEYKCWLADHRYYFQKDKPSGGVEVTGKTNVEECLGSETLDTVKCENGYHMESDKCIATHDDIDPNHWICPSGTFGNEDNGGGSPYMGRMQTNTSIVKAYCCPEGTKMHWLKAGGDADTYAITRGYININFTYYKNYFSDRNWDSTDRHYTCVDEDKWKNGNAQNRVSGNEHKGMCTVGEFPDFTDEQCSFAPVDANYIGDYTCWLLNGRYWFSKNSPGSGATKVANKTNINQCIGSWTDLNSVKCDEDNGYILSSDKKSCIKKEEQSKYDVTFVTNLPNVNFSENNKGVFTYTCGTAGKSCETIYPEIMMPSDHTFRGWSETSSCKTCLSNSNKYNVTKIGQKVFACWDDKCSSEVPANNHYVLLYGNGGTIKGGDNIKVSYEGKKNISELSSYISVAKSGCTLDGWAVGNSTSTTVRREYLDEAEYGKKLYANWKCNSSGESSDGTTETPDIVFSDFLDVDRCYDGNLIHVTSCQPASVVNAECKTSIGNVIRKSLTSKENCSSSSSTGEPQSISSNPGTGTFATVISWLVGLTALFVSFYYFRKNYFIKH